MYDKLLENLTEKSYVQDFGLVGFIQQNGRVNEFDPTEEHADYNYALDPGMGELEYRVWPAGVASSDEVLILRLRSPLSQAQVISLNKLLGTTDYTIEVLEVEFLSSLVGGPKNARIPMTRDWAGSVRKMYEDRSRMYDRLLEKLIIVDEAVATEVDAQKQMKQYYKKILNTKLTKSTWPSNREKNEYKFWLLTDGTVIPVEHSHAKTVNYAGVSGDYNEYSGRDFMETGAAAGYFNLVVDEMGIDCGKKLTKKQIAVLKNLYLEYKVSRLYTDVPGGDFSGVIKSIDHLDYALTYGIDVDEAVATEQVEKEQFFLDRTNKHIQLVQGAAAKIVEAYPEFEKLLKQVERHDQSKLESPEVEPYIEITWRHKLENEKGEYDPFNGKGYQMPGKLEKEDENAATIHHITTNSHHPESHLEDKADANIDDRDKSDECVDASRMPDIDIAEMVADWQAMAEELQTNTTREWFDKQKDVRWHFTEEQEVLIDKLLKVFEEKKEVGEG